MSGEPSVREYIELVELRDQIQSIYQWSLDYGYPSPKEALEHGRRTNDAIAEIRRILGEEASMKISTAAAMHQIAEIVGAIKPTRSLGQPAPAELVDLMSRVDRIV